MECGAIINQVTVVYVRRLACAARVFVLACDECEVVFNYCSMVAGFHFRF